MAAGLALTWTHHHALAERDLGAVEEDGAEICVKISLELDVVAAGEGSPVNLGGPRRLHLR